MNCPSCGGSGFSKLTGVAECFECNGTGALCDTCGEAVDEAGQNICNACARAADGNLEERRS